MRLAIVGSSGYIAGYLSEKLFGTEETESIVVIGRKESADIFLDLTCADKFDYSNLLDIDYIIFAAAVSSPDKCAYDYEACRKVNVEGTCYFIQRALDRGCRVIFLSSDAVYGNIPGYIYSEQSETKAETSYGKMKKAVEDQFKENASFKALRLSYVVSAKDKFVSYCLRCMQENREAEIFHPLYRNCITLNEVANIVVWMMGNWLSLPDAFLNAAGEELVSRIRIADEINRLANGRLKYKIVNPGKEFYLNRPSITQMESIYIAAYKIIKRTSFTEKFRRELEGYICTV